MRKWLIIVLSLVVFTSPALADDDRPINVNQLPAQAQEFISRFFPHSSVAVAKQEGWFMGKNYDVIFCNGDKVEFDKSGVWTNVDCKYSAVPDGIVPEPIAGYVEKHFSGVKITQIEIDERIFEVELSNGVDLKFNKAYKILDVDL